MFFEHSQEVCIGLIMKNPMVHWYEGMFLRPHHFQASDRYWAELVSQNVGLDHPHASGVSLLHISTDFLQNNLFEIRDVQARMPDGTIVESQSHGFSPVNLSERLKDNRLASITVFLARPALVSDKKAVSFQGGELTRYRQDKIESRDENQDPYESTSNSFIEVKKENVGLLFEGEDINGYVTLAIAKLRNVSSGTTKYALVEDFFPPSISLTGWKALEDLLSDLLSFLKTRRDQLAAPLSGNGTELSRLASQNFERVFLVHQLNLATATLNEVISNPRIHPEQAYQCLTSIAGSVAIFSETRRFSEDEVDPYDHSNQCRVFRRIDSYIRRVINGVRFEQLPQSPFIGYANGMRCELSAEWFGPDWEMVLGVHYLNAQGGFKNDLERRQYEQMFSEIQKDWKLGPYVNIEEYFRNQIRALKLEDFDRNSLPPSLHIRGWRFYRILREGEPWHILQTGDPTLGIRIKNELIQNTHNLEGNRQLYLRYDGSNHGFEFTIFAWKKKVI
jgi:type VI secretion system protein ImpJ